MATVYVIYSSELDKFYIGSCLDIDIRLVQHNTREYLNSYTSRAIDWQIYFRIDKLNSDQARKIENHLKRMKSSKYLQNLVLYPEITQKLIAKYCAGSSR